MASQDTPVAETSGIDVTAKVLSGCEPPKIKKIGRSDTSGIVTTNCPFSNVTCKKVRTPFKSPACKVTKVAPVVTPVISAPSAIFLFNTFSLFAVGSQTE